MEAVVRRVDMDTLAKDVVLGVVKVEVEIREVEEVDEASDVVGGLVVTGGGVDVGTAVVAEGAGDVRPPYVHTPSVPRGMLGP